MYSINYTLNSHRQPAMTRKDKKRISPGSMVVTTVIWNEFTYLKQVHCDAWDTQMNHDTRLRALISSQNRLHDRWMTIAWCSWILLDYVLRQSSDSASCAKFSISYCVSRWVSLLFIESAECCPQPPPFCTLMSSPPMILDLLPFTICNFDWWFILPCYPDIFWLIFAWKLW